MSELLEDKILFTAVYDIGHNVKTTYAEIVNNDNDEVTITVASRGDEYILSRWPNARILERKWATVVG